MTSLYDFNFCHLGTDGLGRVSAIETGEKLLFDETNLESFINKMINCVFKDANIKVIQHMLNWANNPFKRISEADIKYVITKEIQDLNQKQSEGKYWNKNTFDSAIKNALSLASCTHVYMCDPSHYNISLNTFNLIKDSLYIPEVYITCIGYSRDFISMYLTYHIHCTDIIHYLWKEKRIDISIIALTSQLQDLTDEVQRLKRKNEALEYQLESKQYELHRLTSKVSQIEQHLPTEMVEYDYEAIKERLDPIREELSIVQRTFKRFINAQYKVPIAILVGKN